MRTQITLRNRKNRMLHAALSIKHYLDFCSLVVKSVWLNLILRRNRQLTFRSRVVTLAGIEWAFVTARYTFATLEGTPTKLPWLLRLARISEIDTYNTADFPRVEDSPYKSGVYGHRTAHAQVSYKQVTEGETQIVRFALGMHSGTLPDRAELYADMFAGRATSRRILNWPIEMFEQRYRRYTPEELRRAVEVEGLDLPTDHELTRQDYIDALVDAKWDKWEVEEARQRAGRLPA